MIKYTDEALVKKARKDVRHFATLIDRYESKLKCYILRISAFSPEEAEELLQEVFLSVWENLNEFDESLKFSSWIYRMAHNRTISAFRAHQTRGLDKKARVDEDLFHNLPSQLNIPQELNQKMNAQKVREVLSSLPEHYKEVLVLYYFEEKKYEEIADVIKKPTGTVSTLIHRAKKAFLSHINKANITF